MSFPKAVRIREVGPREGLQTWTGVVPTSGKLEIIEALSHSGVRDIEITAMVRADRVPQMADAEEVVKQFKRHPGVRYTALYLNPKGFERAEETKRLDNEAWLYGAVSETFLKKNANTTVADSIKSVPEWISAFKAKGKTLHGLMLSTAFGCNYEGAIPQGKVLHVIDGYVQASVHCGALLQEVCLADTMGWATPEMLKRLVAAVREKFPSLALSLHLHDTRGSGMANVYAGLQEGIDCFDSSLGGMGGCPFAKGAAGNVCSEDVVFLCRELGIETGCNVDAYAQAAKVAEKVLGAPLPGKYYKSCS